MGNQSIFHALFLDPNLKTVFTDHSLFGFADTSAIITNKVLQIALWNVDSAICVSHTGSLQLEIEMKNNLKRINFKN